MPDGELQQRLSELHSATVCMESVPESPPALEKALAFHRLGLRLVPLKGKMPLVKDWPALELGESDVRMWSGRGVNWGALTGDPLIVLDTDTDEAEHWVQSKGIHSDVMVQSGGGGLHRWFRKPESVIVIRGKNGLHGIPGLDVKAWHGHIVLPGSMHPETGKMYSFLPGKEFQELGELPLFDPRWVESIQDEPKLLRKSPDPVNNLGKHVRDIRAYIRAIPSIQGQNGSRALMRVCYLLIEQGLSYAEALAEVATWNEVAAFPPWSSRELIRAITNAFQRKHQGNFDRASATPDNPCAP